MNIRIGLLGVGRIGRTHAKAVSTIPRASIAAVYDPDEQAASVLVDRYGAEAASETDELLADPSIDAVLICTPTDTHADLVEAAAKAGKPIFCEKPIDLDPQRVRECLVVVAERDVPLAVGFNRRFDRNFRALKERIEAGEIGDPELVQIVSRDPGPPPQEYVLRSGGLFRDMMIHDFDMGRFLLGEEFVRVVATGSVLVESRIGKAGDVDTASATLSTATGQICVITNSRRATYGYDQRVEVHGSKGMLAVGNPIPTAVTIADASGFHTDTLHSFFMERYQDAYRAEIRAFCDSLSAGKAPSPDGNDGLQALLLAEAAERSVKDGRVVNVDDSAS